MQKSESNRQAVQIHRKVRTSTTLSRRYVKRPSRATADVKVETKTAQAQNDTNKAKGSEIEVAVRRSPRVKHFDISPVTEAPVAPSEPIAPASQHPLQTSAINRMRRRNASPDVHKPSAKELKDAAIKKALANSARTVNRETAAEAKKQQKAKMHFGIGRVVLAMTCAAAAVFAIVYFVNLNMPDISMRVAAMQTGIQASYPGYVPRGYNLTDVSSESGRVTLNFLNDESQDAFSLTEENSSWDSNALLTNFVKPEYGDNYAIIREQGLTIYISDSDAAWVNGGVVYKLRVTSGSLTKKQIRSIAVSL